MSNCSVKTTSCSVFLYRDSMGRGLLVMVLATSVLVRLLKNVLSGNPCNAVVAN